MSPPVHDLLGVGIGPFNLSLAALLDPVGDLDAVFFDQAEAFAWHPGLLLEGATTQVPFLADLVTLADPTSRHSFLEYLRAHDRLYRFYLRERFHLPRREYDHYCRWVAGRLPGCRFGTRVEGLRWLEEPGLFEAELTEVASGRASRRRARNLVIGVGTTPAVPGALAGALGKDVFHAAEFLEHRERLRQAAAVTVVGSGQSGAEVFLELLREQPGCGYRLDWLTRSAGFFPMEYSRLGLEHFTPDYTRYFHGLPGPTRDRLLPTQDLLYKGIDAETIAEIHELLYERTVAGAEAPVRLLAHAEVRSLEPAGGRWKLAGRQWEQGRDFTVEADCVVLATGYRDGPPACLDGLAGLVDWDRDGRYQVGLDYRVATDPRVTGGLYVQNGELHTHGVGAPDLGLGANRAATIVNALTGREVYRLPGRSAFTDFGVD
ncbi:MAG: lysine N(6)-hydroxylase/L-ornithine N(5)-oxygenase family protein [Actinomycetota bacterium]|nr:lysine N(6)-hydroxylase/L-ornithine N(5)-oxygenase family protein [Actinomycetota bacterium]